MVYEKLTMTNETTRLNVLHVASGDLWAGAEVQLFTLATALKKKPEVNVSVVLLNHGTLEEKLLASDIQVSVLDESKLNFLQLLHRLTGLVRELNPDIIHTHRIKENILGSIAAWKSGNIVSLRTAHGAPEHLPAWHHIPKRLILFMDWFCGRFMQRRIIAVSQDLAKVLKKEYPNSQIKTIENGINAHSLIKNHERAVSNEQLPQRPIKIGIAGRLVPVKRVDLFIQSARYLRDHYPELKATFHIYGDGPLYEELTFLNQELKTSDIVYFEGHCEDIHNKIRDLNILLMTSDHEGLPMILLEAMALQTPIIAHRTGGIPHLLNQGVAGVLVNKHCAEAYAEEIYRLATNPERRKEITQNALSRVMAHYSAEQNAKFFLEEYKTLLQTSKD